jgi:phage gp46-like protein
VSARIEQGASIKELVRMSLGTNKGAWFADPAFGSDLWLLRKEGKVDGQTAGNLERIAREALQWLVDDGLAMAIDCAAEPNGKSRIDYQVTVTLPDGESVEAPEVFNVI